MAADWTLGTCCNTPQIVYVCCFGGYLIINALLWKTPVVKPLKLVAVFVHEMSHAIACWCTGGKVKAIQVFDNEGGVTKFTGGVMTLVIPAGYLGCAFWGMVFIVLSADVIAATIAASLFTAGLIAALFFSPNGVMIALNLGFAALTIGFILIQWLVPGIRPFDDGYFPLLTLVVLYYGVFIGSFGVYDIYDDLITRTVEGSDAYACHKLYPCCFPRCVGVIWAIIALALMGAGLYLGLVWMGAYVGGGAVL